MANQELQTSSLNDTVLRKQLKHYSVLMVRVFWISRVKQPIVSCFVKSSGFARSKEMN